MIRRLIERLTGKTLVSRIQLARLHDRACDCADDGARLLGSLSLCGVIRAMQAVDRHADVWSIHVQSPKLPGRSFTVVMDGRDHLGRRFSGRADSFSLETALGCALNAYFQEQEDRDLAGDAVKRAGEAGEGGQ